MFIFPYNYEVFHAFYEKIGTKVYAKGLFPIIVNILQVKIGID